MTSIAIIEAVSTSYVPFNGQQIITAMAAGVAYVAMKPIVENLGMSWSTQMRKLLNQKDKYGYAHMNIPSKGGIQEMLCLPLKKLNGWLFSINPEKVRADIRDKLIQYQEECFTVLHDYWTKGAAVRPIPETSVDDRTPLRGIVNRIMGKYGLTYQAVYKLVHKEFGVKHIDELSPKQTAEAIEYLASKAIEGEFLGKQESLPELVTKQFTDSELYELVCLWSISLLLKDDVEKLIPALDTLGSPWSRRMSGNIGEITDFINRAGKLLMRESSHIAAMPNPPVNWRLELSRMKNTIN